MQKKSSAESGILNFRVVILVVIGSLVVSLGWISFAAAPATGTVTSTIGSQVTWVGTAPGTGAANGESTCVDGVNCDVFTLTVSGVPADYVGKAVQVTLDWTVPANDYDLVIHKDTVTGAVVSTSGNGPPAIHEQAGINPSATGTGTYVVHVIYFAVAVPNTDQFAAKAITVAQPAKRTANYIKGGGITFSPNFTVKAPNTVRDGEPSSRTDFKGNHYICGIRGVPAGVDLWYFDLNPSSPNYDPLMTNPIYRGQPDSFLGKDPNAVGADGGGDVDLAVSFSTPTGQTDPTVAFTSLVAANISVGKSTNKGALFSLNPVGNGGGGVPVDDREWQEFFGANTVFLLYRTLDPVIAFVQRSIDGGFTYEPAVQVGPSAQTGYIDVNQNDGTVYCFFNDGRVAVGIPAAPGLAPATYTFHQAASDPFNVDHKFCMGKVVEDGTANGTVYVCYSNDQDVFLTHSTDKGTTWSLPVRVSDVPGGTNLWPWMETGPTPGSVAVAWFGSPNQPFNNDNANWKVYFAQSFNANTATPTFTQVEASDHFIHGSNISEGGLTGTANRNLIDYFQISVDPQGAAVVGFADDHNDSDGASFVARQISGPSLKGGNISLPSPIPLAAPRVGEEAPPPQPGAGGEQVTDFAQDARDTAPARVLVNSPVDILSIKYSSAVVAGKLMLTATMKVSDLPALPPNATYRMSFSANAPDAVLSATGDYSYGLSDRGNQFFFGVTTTAANTPTYRYGTAVRESSGALTFTNAGIADSGSFDSGAKTITVNVDVAKFNAILTAASKPLIQTGSALAGLRGTASGGGMSDSTRGGTLFVVGGVGLESAVSRKTHGTAGTFDVNLPLIGAPGIECRTGGASGNHQIVVTFAGPVTVSSASVTSGTGSLSSFSVSGNQVFVNLTGVTNAQIIAVTLGGVNDGTSTGSVVIPMAVLAGDTTADTFVNSGDIAQTKSQSGQPVSGSNFREDVTIDGNLNSGDIALVKSKSGTALPPGAAGAAQPSNSRVTSSARNKSANE